MAEAVVNKDEEVGDKVLNPECAVCLQTCVHPAQLPCGHIFCYLCVKGFANQNKRCAMCRQEIPRDFVDQPHLLNMPQADVTENFDGGYQWFYEGRNGWWKYDSRATEEIEEAFKLQLPQFDLIICGDLYVIDFVNGFQYSKAHPSRKRSIRRDKMTNLVVKGWWQYDERTSKELENSYKNGDKSIELLIAGFLYIVDFENMLQLRRNDPSRRRQIKRDVSTIPKKGVAGIRTNPLPTSAFTDYRSQEARPGSPTEGRSANATPITPSNTPQSPTSGRESPNREQDLQATVDLISSLRLDCDRSDNRSDSENE